MSLRKPTATISSSSTRAAEWMRVYGSLTIPIKSPVPVAGSAPGLESVRFYHVNVAELTADQRGRLVTFICEKFRRSPAEVERDLDDPDHGVPILADDVTVTFDARMVV